MTKQVSVGIVGTGRMAARMAQSLQAMPGMHVVAVASATEDRARGFAARLPGMPRAYGSTAGLLADPEVDLVYVANAARHHAATSIGALEQGKAVLCEKPFALDPQEAQRVVAAAAESGCFFMEAMWILALPAHQRLAQMIRDARFGAPRHMQFSFGYPVHADDRPQLLFPEDGGVLFDRAGYGVTLAISLLGPVSEEQGLVSEEGSDLLLLHSSGARSQITVSAGALLPNTVTVGCDRGVVGLDAPSLAAEHLWSQTMLPHPVGRGNEPGAGQGIKARLRQSSILRHLRARALGPRRLWLPYGPDPYLPMLTHVLDLLRRGQTASPLVPPALSMAVIQTLSAVGKRGAS